jgi:surfeit locus 1 family protein
MLRQIPILPTIVVLIAVAIMVRLGVWQLDRLHEKEALLARYATAQAMTSDVPFPDSPAAAAMVLYRHATVDCQSVLKVESISGRSAKNESGIGHVAICALAGGARARIVLGWSRDPKVPAWSGGKVSGIIAPGPRLIANPPLAGLAASAPPDPQDITNNHLAYAVQWFLFAGVALVIYGLAVRKRLAGNAPPR